MIDSYKTIYQSKETEIIEKKSRFITNIKYVETEEEAMAFLESIRKKYWDARHHCWAYVLGKRQEILRCSDDGEPQGTAGRPMLDVMTGAGICDAIIVVTRYFGGTLLGTGGLVRAYSKAVQTGLESGTIVERIYGQQVELTTDYNGLGKVQYLLAKEGIPTLEASYETDVKIKILLPVSMADQMETKLIDATNGKIAMERQEKQYYAMLDGALLTGESLVAHT